MPARSGRPSRGTLERHGDAHPLLRSRLQLDGGPHRLARGRRLVRGAAALLCPERAARGRLPAPQSRRQGADAAHRRQTADGGRGHPVLSRPDLSRGGTAAAGRWRSRGPGHFVDVVHCRHHPSGTASRPRLCRPGVGHRGAAPGRAGMGDRPLLDRRHPSVSPLLALREFAASGAEDVPEPIRPS